MTKTRKCALPLMLLGLLPGCGLIPKAAPIAHGNLCKDWRHETITKDDKLTEKTAAQIEASNKSRPNWGCKYGQNKG